MARLNYVKKAQKDIYVQGKVVKHTKTTGKNKGQVTEKLIRTIPANKEDKVLVKKGEGYYWWKFRFGGIRISPTRPRRSQLTQSDFLGQVYDIEDEMNEATGVDESMVNEWISSIESLRDECQDKLDNMPDQLRDASSSGQLLQERVDNLESWISELENVDLEVNEESIREEAISGLEQEEGETDEAFADRQEDEFQEKLQERKDEITSEVSSTSPGF